MLPKEPSKEIQYKKAPLLDRLRIDLTEEKQKELITWMDQEKSDIESSRTNFQDRQRKYLHNWDDFITSTRKGSWENASNLHLPLTSIVVKSLHARFYEIFTNESTVQLIPRETMNAEYAALFAHLYKWYTFDYLNGFKGIKGFLREIFYDTVTVGFGIGIKDWMLKQRKIIIVEPNQLKELQKEMADLAPQVEELAKKKPLLETDEEMLQNVIDLSPYKESHKIVTVFEGTRLRSVPWENAYFPNDLEESNDLDSCRYAMIQTEMSEGTLNLKAEQGLFNKESVEKTVAHSDTQLGTRASEVKQDREKMTGISSQHLDNGKFTIQQAFITYDIDDDGMDEELVIVRSEKGEILNINYLDRISPTGMRPLFKFDCFSKPRQAYSRGVPEFMYPLNEEVDIMHNKRIDMLTLQTTPFGVYKAGSSLKKQPIRIAPGKLIPVDETTDVRLLSWGSSASPLAGEQAQLWAFAERLASTSSLNQGITPDTVGATRSTSGVLTLLKQAQKEFIASVDQNAVTYRKMTLMNMADLDFRIPTDTKLRVLGARVTDPSNVIKNYRNELSSTTLHVNGQFDVKIDVASSINSEEVRRNEAQLALQTTTTPTIAQQMGIIGPKAVYQAYKNWYYAYGHDPKDFMDEPQFITKALTLYQELQICGTGEIPPMAMQDDHEAKAQQLIMAAQSPEYQEALAKGLLVANFMEFVQKAAQKHATIAQMLQPKGLPNPAGTSGQEGQAEMGVAPQQGGQDPNQTTSRDTSPIDTGGPKQEPSEPQP